MRSLIIFAILAITAAPALAKPKRYMVCLGQEEAKFHKQKVAGPTYKLNQEIISSLVQLRESIYMKKRHVDEVCNANHPSIKLLELLMTKNEVFFSVFTEKRTPRRLAIDKATLMDLQDRSAMLFVNFLNQIQAGLEKPNCLQRAIPELEKFFEKMQFILEDVGLQNVLKSLEDPRKIFEKLQTLNFSKIEC